MRRIFQIAAGLVLVLATLTPLVEFVDYWDKNNTVPANDTELTATVWFVGIGFVLTMGNLLRFVPALAGSKKHSSRVTQTTPALQPGERPRPASTAGPPLVPLRI